MQWKDEDAGSRGIMPNVAEKHKGRAQQTFSEREKDRCRRVPTAGMLRCKSPERKVSQHQDQRHGEAAGCSVRKLNQSGDLRSMGNHLPATQWPVIAAACSRASGADNRTPQNHPNVVGEHEPGICRKAPRSCIFAAFPHKESMVTHQQCRNRPRQIPVFKHGELMSAYLVIGYDSSVLSLLFTVGPDHHPTHQPLCPLGEEGIPPLIGAGVVVKNWLGQDTKSRIAVRGPSCKIPTDRSRIFSYSQLSGRLMVRWSPNPATKSYLSRSRLPQIELSLTIQG